jgi:hypothetical protein
MKTYRPRFTRHRQAGVALLIAIFVLLLVSVAAMAMVISSGTDAALAGNYRASTGSYYAAVAGLEEVRGRLSSKDPNYFGVAIPNPVPLNSICYLTNPANGETVDPKTSGSTYGDTQYAHEFSAAPVVNAYINSVWNGATPGPLYKWVRVNAVTEQSLNIDVNQDNIYNNTIPLYYDGTRFNLTNTGAQVLEITALAALPGGTQRMVQYTIASPLPLIASFPSALTLDGPSPAYGTPHSNNYRINGADRQGPSGAGTCGSPLQPTQPAIGVVTAADGGSSGTVAGQLFRPDHYTGTGSPPSVVNVSGSGTNTLPANMQTVSGLEQLAQSFSTLPGVITLTDASGTGTGACTSAPPSWGTAGSPVTIFAHCALDMSSASPGYGTLVVTGDLSAGGNFGWRGIILGIGQGSMSMNGGGNGEFDGAIVLAKTHNSSGALLATPGTPSISWSGGGGNGLYYDSCWINSALANTVSGGYPILSFRELGQ